MLNKQTVIRTRRKILQIMADDLSLCAWPELYINEYENTKLNHAFECIFQDDGRRFIFSSGDNLIENIWHTVEYTQLPIRNTNLAELTLKVNGNCLQKIINADVKEYQNVNVYYGFDKNKKIDESTIPDGKISNFTIEKNDPGRLKQ